jgi:hypothetical protein
MLEIADGMTFVPWNVNLVSVGGASIDLIVIFGRSMVSKSRLWGEIRLGSQG